MNSWTWAIPWCSGQRTCMLPARIGIQTVTYERSRVRILVESLVGFVLRELVASDIFDKENVCFVFANNRNLIVYLCISTICIFISQQCMYICKSTYPYTDKSPTHVYVSSLVSFKESLTRWMIVSFRSVVVITLASHARGPGFETQRKQPLVARCFSHSNAIIVTEDRRF